jgi:hypothetical protein
VQGPAAHLRRFQDFGIDLELGRETVFPFAFTTMDIFLIANVTQEADSLHAWLDPAYATSPRSRHLSPLPATMVYAPEEQALFTGSSDKTVKHGEEVACEYGLRVKKWNVQTGF